MNQFTSQKNYFFLRTPFLTNTSPKDYYEPGGAEYMEGLIKGKWSYLIELNAVPSTVMSEARMHPLIRLTISFFLLARAGDGGKNLGFAFACFR